MACRACDRHTPLPQGPPLPPRLVGTDAFSRPFTDAERKAADRLLSKHGFSSARLIALAFAQKKCRNHSMALDVLDRAIERLARTGWDPAEVPLVKRLNRLVYSEWTHEIAERKVQREAERRFAHREWATMEAQSSPEGPSEREAREAEEEAASQAHLAELRARFEAAEDQVNVDWLDCFAEGLTTPEQMAQRMKREPREFYLAADRRKGHIERLIEDQKRLTLKEKP